MDSQKINKIIAEYCGWRMRGIINGQLYMWPPNGGDAVLCPVYASSLDCMHEAEKKLVENRASIKGNKNQSEIDSYIWWILAELDYRHDSSKEILLATSQQKANAFVKMLGKWEDGDSPL